MAKYLCWKTLYTSQENFEYIKKARIISKNLTDLEKTEWIVR